MATAKELAQGAVNNTVVGQSILISGKLTGDEDLTVRGRVEELTINGEASGNIDAGTRVAINASAKVSGDIKTPRVVIEDGAVFNGSIEMDVKLPDDI